MRCGKVNVFVLLYRRSELLNSAWSLFCTSSRYMNNTCANICLNTKMYAINSSRIAHHSFQTQHIVQALHTIHFKHKHILQALHTIHFKHNMQYKHCTPFVSNITYSTNIAHHLFQAQHTVQAFHICYVKATGTHHSYNKSMTLVFVARLSCVP